MAVIHIRGIREQINQRLEKVSARRKAEIQKLADGVLKPLTAVEEEVYQVRNRSSQDPLNYPIMLNNKIAALTGVIESADNKPTQPELRGVQGAVGAARRGAAEDEATRSKQLPRLNAAFKREKLERGESRRRSRRRPRKPHRRTPSRARSCDRLTGCVWPDDSW